MDEVGLICSRITDDGFIKFKCVGGIDTRVLVSKKVRIGRRLISGVIGAKAIHLQEKEEREQVPKVTDLYIDIGAKDKAEAEKHVSVGDYCVFDSEFVEFGSGFIKAKALDDRLGCACLMSLAEERFAFDLYLVFTVQEEVGLRGARVAAERIRPDAAIVLEGTTCSDVYGTDEKDYSTISGGGAALSIRAVTGKPIKFAGIGEKLDELEVFHPERMASRILGMGDVLSLIEKAEQQIDRKQAEELARKMQENKFDLNDMLDQFAQIKKMGNIKSMLGMLPGVGKQLQDVDIDERQFDRVEAIILSMTPAEREKPDIINPSRKRRIAAGCGMKVEDVNRLLKQYDTMRRMMKQVRGMGKGKKGLRGMGKMPPMPPMGRRGF